MATDRPLMSAHDAPLLTALEQLAPHDHLCSIYESPEEHLAVAIPFIRIGLDRGEKCIYIADDGTEAAVLDAMYAGGIDVERAIATDSLVLEKKEAAYLKHGSFDPEWMFRFWADATAEALRTGFPALRATGETEWVLRGDAALERWIEYESHLTHMLAHHNCSALCQYNRLLLPPELALAIIRTHPTVIYRGVVCRNMYHVPPDELLATNQAAREVERLLTNMREREEIEYTLRQQRDRLRRSEACLAEGQRISHTGSWAWNPASGEMFWSEEHFRILGLDPSYPITSSDLFFEMVHQEDRDDVRRTFQQAIDCRSEIDCDYRVARPDGTIRYIHSLAHPVVDESGSLLEYVGTVVDVTEQRRADEALRDSERLLRVVLDALPVGVAVVDRSGNIILSNPASQRIWGRSIRSGLERYAESKGWWHATGKRVAPEEWASARAFVNGETSVNDVLDIETFDGVRKIIQNSAVPIRDTDERITGAVVVNEDISARKTAERKLNDSYNQMRTLTGRLMRAQDDERRRIARSLHETTAQDLAALKMLLARLNRSDRLGDGERGALAESMSLAEQSITEIRTLSYLLHPPFLDETGLSSALRWYAAGFAERSGIKVDLDLPDSLERLPLDTETALFRIVQESLINIHRHAGSETARIRVRRDAEALVLEIDDRGRGIPNASLKHVMSGRGVAGVGIAGMGERIQQLGGRLEILSDEHGTTVRVRLPLAKYAG